MNLEEEINKVLFEIGKEIKIHKITDDNTIIEINYAKYTKKLIDLFNKARDKA